MKFRHIGCGLLMFCMVISPYRGFAMPLAVSLSPMTTILNQIQEPRDLAEFMKENFELAKDQDLFGHVDYWQSPADFWELRKGDCEDYALFAKHVFDLKGVESFVVSFYGPHYFAHTVTLYREDNLFNVINEDRLYEYRAKTIEEALTQIEPTWTWGAIAEKRGTRGWMVEKIMWSLKVLCELKKANYL